jgi:hypothetical protein
LLSFPQTSYSWTAPNVWTTLYHLSEPATAEFRIARTKFQNERTLEFPMPELPHCSLSDNVDPLRQQNLCMCW